MASYTTLDTNSLLPGEPLTSSKVLALNENPAAIAEGGTNAPIARTGWHGYDQTLVGDTTVPFYNDTAVTSANGAETPNFEDGYEYRVLGRAIEAATLSANLVVDVLIDGSWENILTTTGAAGNDKVDFDLWIRSPRRSSRRFVLDYSFAFTDTGAGWGPTNGTQENGLAQIAGDAGDESVITRMRVRTSAGNMDGGEMYLLRRREY